MTDNHAVGKRVRDARVAKGLTQEQLAELAGVSPTYISVVERGIKSPQLDTFVPLCNALGVSADSLLVDVVDAATLNATNELADLLRGKPRETQLLALRVIKAIVSED